MAHAYLRDQDEEKVSGRIGQVRNVDPRGVN
jgi:hypothetical protein